MQTIEAFRTSDGTVFDEYQEAMRYENKLRDEKEVEAFVSDAYPEAEGGSRSTQMRKTRAREVLLTYFCWKRDRSQPDIFETEKTPTFEDFSHIPEGQPDVASTPTVQEEAPKGRGKKR